MRRLGRFVTKARQLPVKTDELPPISVIVTTHNQEVELRHNLQLILDQYYPSFEVIVVDMASKDGTKNFLEKMEEDHPNLRHTFTPPTSRDISLSRLAITLGMKAASHPWVLITTADCAPVSHSWILHMANARCHHRSAQLVLGYTRYHQLGQKQGKMQHFNLWQQMMALPYAAKHGAYRTGGENIIYSRDLFMQHQGFASSATLLTGATDIMVNHHSKRDNTTVCVQSDAVLSKNIQNVKRAWKQERLFFQETRTHFHRRFLYRAEYALRVFIHFAMQALLISAMVVGIVVGMAENPLWYIASGIALVLWFIHLITQGLCYNFTAKLVDDRKQNFLLTEWYITLTPLWDLNAWIRHKFTSSRKFRKKYI